MTALDSNDDPAGLPIGPPIEPRILPAGQEEETPEQQREFNLAFEYETEVIRLETKLNKKIKRIHALEHPIGNPKEDLARESLLAKLENEADKLRHKIDLRKKWLATKPVNLDGIPADADTPPGDTALDPSDAALGKHYRKRSQNFGKTQAEAKQEVREQEWQRWCNKAKEIQAGKTKPVSKRRMAALVKGALHLPDSIEVIRKQLK